MTKLLAKQIVDFVAIDLTSRKKIGIHPRYYASCMERCEDCLLYFECLSRKHSGWIKRWWMKYAVRYSASQE